MHVIKNKNKICSVLFFCQTYISLVVAQRLNFRFNLTTRYPLHILARVCGCGCTVALQEGGPGFKFWSGTFLHVIPVFVLVLSRCKHVTT